MIQFKMLKNKKGELRSRFGEEKPWVVGKWKHVKGRIVLCANGFHCSPHPLEAHRYCVSRTLAMVEVKGDASHERHGSKSAYRSMKVLGAYSVTVNDVRAFMKFIGTLPQTNLLPIYKHYGWLDTVRAGRELAAHAVTNAPRGHKKKNLEAMTQWWIDRAATEMKAIA